MPQTQPEFSVLMSTMLCTHLLTNVQSISHSVYKLNYMSFLGCTNSFINFTEFSKFHIINQLVETPINVIFVIKNYNYRNCVNFTKRNICKKIKEKIENNIIIMMINFIEITLI